MDKVYVVTSGIYEDYTIEAIFKDRIKAENYCSLHFDCRVEEYSFSDDNIYKSFHFVRIRYDIYLNQQKKDNIQFEFCELSEEYSSCSRNSNFENVLFNSNDWLTIRLNRKLPDEYDEEKIKAKYTKVFYDFKTELKYMLIEDNIKNLNKKEINKYKNSILESLKSKFGFEIE